VINTNSGVFVVWQGLVTSFSIPEKICYGAAHKAISTIYTDTKSITVVGLSTKTIKESLI